MIENKKQYKNYVCSKCFNQVNKCTCDYAPYTLIQIDEKIQNAIRALNMSGIYTQQCCAGHYARGCNSDIYITFVNRPQTCPNGWKFIPNGFCYNFKPRSKKDFLETQTKALEALRVWTEEQMKF